MYSNLKQMACGVPFIINQDVFYIAGKSELEIVYITILINTIWSINENINRE